MTHSIQSVCVYCSASRRLDPKYSEMAFAVGQKLAKAGLKLIYGGGRLGLMGRVADGCMEAGGKAYGITTVHLEELEQAHSGLTKLDIVDDMHTRKARMFDYSDAIVVLPGGFGTLDEVIEILTWKQIGLHSKPIIIFNFESYWTPLKVLMEHVVRNKFAAEEHLHMVQFVDDAHALMEALKQPVGENALSDWI